MTGLLHVARRAARRAFTRRSHECCWRCTRAGHDRDDSRRWHAQKAALGDIVGGFAVPALLAVFAALVGYMVLAILDAGGVR